MFSTQRILGLFFFLAALTGTMLADTVPPPDPIVDLEGGTGSNPYTGGLVTFIVNFNNSACGPPNPNDIVSCGTTSNFLRPGADGTGVFRNNTGVDITNIHVSIETFFGLNGTGDMANVAQGTFSEFPTGGGIFPGPIIMDPTGNGATFTGGDVTGCPIGVELCTPGEFLIGYAEVLVPEGGSAVVEFDANHPLPTPEPGTLALLAGALPGLWLIRNKKLIRP